MRDYNIKKNFCKEIESNTIDEIYNKIKKIGMDKRWHLREHTLS